MSSRILAKRIAIAKGLSIYQVLFLKSQTKVATLVESPNRP